MLSKFFLAILRILGGSSCQLASRWQRSSNRRLDTRRASSARRSRATLRPVVTLTTGTGRRSPDGPRAAELPGDVRRKHERETGRPGSDFSSIRPPISSASSPRSRGRGRYRTRSSCRADRTARRRASGWSRDARAVVGDGECCPSAGRAGEIVTVVPDGVDDRILEQDPTIWRTRSSSPRATPAWTRPQLMAAAAARGPNSTASDPATASRSRLSAATASRPASIRQIEQAGGELRQAAQLVAHRPEELGGCPSISSSSSSRGTVSENSASAARATRSR